MSDISNASDMELWLSDVKAHITEVAPEMLPLLDTYSCEALFGRQFIARDLDQFQRGSAILEVGAGCMLLSCQLVREGFNVSALEPIGTGFSHFELLRELIIERAIVHSCMPDIINLPVEKLSVQNHFDYAFSINVMEHVENVELSLSQVGNSLKPKAIYRFTCPNYLFPYEPHFNCLTLFSKRLTEKYLGKKIFLNKLIPDVKGTWESLNWINVAQIRRRIKQLPELCVSFNRNLLIATFDRIVADKEFAKRRSSWICSIIRMLVKLRLHYLTWFIPVLFQPIIDCKITRLEE